MFKTLKAMFDYLGYSWLKDKSVRGQGKIHKKLAQRMDKSSNEWEDTMFCSLCFVLMLVLGGELVFSSPAQLAHIYGIPVTMKGGIGYLSFVHLMLLVGVFSLSLLLILWFVEVMKDFQTKVKNKKCSIVLIPIPLVALLLSCLLVFLYRHIKSVTVRAWGVVERLMSSLWVYTVIDESDKGSISKKTKTIL